MNTKLSGQTGSKSFTTNQDHLLWQVWIWEIRRVFANPLNWLFGAGTFLFFMGMMWFKHAWSLGVEKGLPLLTLYGTSAVGLLYEFTVVLMFTFAIILPFVVTDGVARDYKKRMHEILMTTPITGTAYVWGRFLAVLSLALGQALLMLFASWIMGSILHLRNGVYPQPGWSNLLMVWVLIVLPPTILISGLGFGLGTLWPRRTRAIMVGILIAWILLFTVSNVIGINPTGASVVGNLIPQLVQNAQSAWATIPTDQRGAFVQQIQAKLPDLSSWFLPQYSLAAVGLLFAAAAAAGFRRFRNELD
jgi:ABC-type transport system involved in multi-copper enzyme maturation permease subunit